MRYEIDTIDDMREILRRARGEYIEDSDTDDDRLRATKEILRTLSADEQTLLILHTEIGSYRQLAKVFGVSRTTILNRVAKIKTKIRNKMTNRYGTRTTIHHTRSGIHRRP